MEERRSRQSFESAKAALTRRGFERFACRALRLSRALKAPVGRAPGLRKKKETYDSTYETFFGSNIDGDFWLIWLFHDPELSTFPRGQPVGCEPFLLLFFLFGGVLDIPKISTPGLLPTVVLEEVLVKLS